MNYIYDVILNFNNEIYDFYEWNAKDNILHLKKIPIIKISTKDFLNIKNYDVKISLESIKYLKNKVELFGRKVKQNLEYIFLITDGFEVLALQITDKIKYSKLLLEEEIDSRSKAKYLSTVKIDYKLLQKKKENDFKTRYEKSRNDYIKKELNKIKQEQNQAKIDYIYYECSNNRISANLNDLETVDQNKLYNVLKMIKNV